MNGPHNDSLSLPRSLAGEHRYSDALVAYRRAITTFEATGDIESHITAKVESFLVLVESEAVEDAIQEYDELHALLDRTGHELEKFDALMLPLYLRVLQGDSEGVFEEMEEYLEANEDGTALDEVVSMMAFGASVHDRNGSPLAAARLLIEIAELCESVALENNDEKLGSDVARAYWEHARFLAAKREQCIFQAEAGCAFGLEGLAPDEWRAFVVATLDEFEAAEGMEDAVSSRILKSLDASDAWGPATSTLRSLVGRCRVITLVHDQQLEAAGTEARRVVPIAEQAGDLDCAAALRQLPDLLSWGNEGPDLDGFDFGI